MAYPWVSGCSAHPARSPGPAYRGSQACSRRLSPAALGAAIFPPRPLGGGGTVLGQAPPLPARRSRGRGVASGRAGNMAEAEGESLESWLSEYPEPPGPQHRSPQPVSLPRLGSLSPPDPVPPGLALPAQPHGLMTSLLPPLPSARRRPLSGLGPWRCRPWGAVSTPRAVPRSRDLRLRGIALSGAGGKG